MDHGCILDVYQLESRVLANTNLKVMRYLLREIHKMYVGYGYSAVISPIQYVEQRRSRTYVHW